MKLTPINIPRHASFVVWIVAAALVAFACWTAWDGTHNDWLAYMIVLGSVWGLGSTSWTLKDTVLEYRDAPKGDEPLREIASANIRREILRIGSFIALLFLGVQIVLPGGAPPNVARLVIVLIIEQLVANSVLDRIERHNTAILLAVHRHPRRPLRPGKRWRLL